MVKIIELVNNIEFDFGQEMPEQTEYFYQLVSIENDFLSKEGALTCDNFPIFLYDDITFDRIPQNVNLYYNVNPLKTSTILHPTAKGGKKDVIAQACIYLDIDAKSDDIYNKLTKLPILPTHIVDSGNGYHAYWVLDEWNYDLELASDLQKRFVHYIRDTFIPEVDKACVNLDRILRVPFSDNVKGELKQCRYVYESNGRVSINSFVELLEGFKVNSKSHITKAKKERKSVDIDIAAWENKADKLDIQFDETTERHTTCLDTMIWMQQNGYDYESIERFGLSFVNTVRNIKDTIFGEHEMYNILNWVTSNVDEWLKHSTSKERKQILTAKSYWDNSEFKRDFYKQAGKIKKANNDKTFQVVDFIIDNYFFKFGIQCALPVEHIANAMGISKNTVSKALRMINTGGLIQLVSEYNHFSKTARVYRLVLSAFRPKSTDSTPSTSEDFLFTLNLGTNSSILDVFSTFNSIYINIIYILDTINPININNRVINNPFEGVLRL